MKKFKRLIAVLITAAMILSMSACSGGGGNTSSDNSSSNSSEKEGESSENSESKGTDAPLETKDNVNQNDNTNGGTLKYLGCYDLTKAGDIKAFYKHFKEQYNSEIEVEIVPDGTIMEKLAAYIQADASPDLVDKRDNSFPYFIGQNMYAPLDDYIDLDTPEWMDVKDFIDSVQVKGKHYYYPWVYVVSGTFLIYNRGLFEEYGVDDPNELYENNDWTWDTFKKCMTDFITKSPEEDTLGVYGAFNTSFINSTGKAMISYEDGQLVNNIKTTEIERAQNFLEQLRKEGISNIQYKDYNNVATEPLIGGNAAFHSMGDWIITTYSTAQMNDSSLDFFFVPFPRDPNASEYYHKLGTFGYFVPAGSKNVDLAAKFITCARLKNVDDELAEKIKTSTINSKNYTEEQYERWEYFQDFSNFENENLIEDYSTSLSKNIYDDYMVHMLEDIAFVQGEDQLTWTFMRESYIGAIDDDISRLNALLQ